MAFVSECLQSTVEEVGDDDAALVVDANAFRVVELAWLTAMRAELEQERAIDRRQYLHSMVAAVRDDDSMSIIIDRNARWMVEIARLRSFLAADLEQERKIDRRQEHQPCFVRVHDDDAMMMPVDCNALRAAELEISWLIRANRRQERLVAQGP